ncbi:MAG: parB-like partition protein [Acidobacteriales bacterium]|nr:parB-like partition protein [Terriglobales bacterium]
MATATTSQPQAPPVPASPVLHHSFQDIPLALIHPSPTNPRKYFDEAAMEDLAASIRQNGILQPLLLRPRVASKADVEVFEHRLHRIDEKLTLGQDYFEVVAGERRFRAAHLAGLESVPAMTRELTDQQVLEMQLVENLQREDVTALEEGVGYTQLLSSMVKAQPKTAKQKHVQTIANTIGKSPRYVYARMKLDESLIPAAKAALASGKIMASHADELVRLEADDQLHVLDQEMFDHNDEAISVRALKAQIEEILADRGSEFDENGDEYPGVDARPESEFRRAISQTLVDELTAIIDTGLGNDDTLRGIFVSTDNERYAVQGGVSSGAEGNIEAGLRRLYTPTEWEELAPERKKKYYALEATGKSVSFDGCEYIIGQEHVDVGFKPRKGKKKAPILDGTVMLSRGAKAQASRKENRAEGGGLGSRSAANQKRQAEGDERAERDKRIATVGVALINAAGKRLEEPNMHVTFIGSVLVPAALRRHQLQLPQVREALEHLIGAQLKGDAVEDADEQLLALYWKNYSKISLAKKMQILFLGEFAQVVHGWEDVAEKLQAAARDLGVDVAKVSLAAIGKQPAKPKEKKKPSPKNGTKGKPSKKKASVAPKGVCANPHCKHAVADHYKGKDCTRCRCSKYRIAAVNKSVTKKAAKKKGGRS